jgi:ferric-dicitrate binding protein FerR (iron transport regulator)
MGKDDALPPDHIEHIIIKFLQGEATPEETDFLERWVNEDARHREQFREVNRTFQVAVKLPRFNPKRVDAAWEVFADKIHSDNKKHRSFFTLRNPIAVRIAASVLVLLVAGISWWTYSDVSTQQKAFVQYTNLEKTRIVLPDNSVVWLNANSTLSYDADFGESTRKVILKGEAFFDVTKSQKEFVVSTDNLSIHVKGTRFNVSTLKDGKEETTLEEGRVILKVKGTKQSYDLRPGDQVTYNRNSNHIERNQVKPSNYSSWKEEILLLENLSLRDIADKLEARYKVTIVIDSAIAQRENLTMSIREETLVEVLELIKLSTSLNYTIDGNEVTLYE